MTVSTYNPNLTTPVSFSAPAIAHLANQVKNKQAIGIEFKVKESGCSGYKYLLELAEKINPDATSYEISKELTLYVSPSVVHLIKGTQVDYVKDGVNYQLTFKNPNATASCGCGESFSVSQHD